MATKKKDGDTEAPYKDVSADAEKAADATVDEEGNLDAKASEASANVDTELSHRAAGAGEGGGPWPEEVLRRRFLSAGQ